MKVLLDTNIIIHREAAKVVHEDIGILFHWLDKLSYVKCIHPITIEELKRHQDRATVSSMTIKAGSYTLIKNPAPVGEQLMSVAKQVDTSPNDANDTLILNELFSERVDILISEDNKIHRKAAMLGIGEKVFKIDQFLEKVTVENPELVDYKVLSVKKSYFAKVNLQDAFFDSFREDYIGFDKWFNKKSDEIAYTCYSGNRLTAFLYIKMEDETENYSDILPLFGRKRRLKIGTFKVISNGYRIGERFLKIIFDNALLQRVTEIYVTIFNKCDDQLRLISLLEAWGFVYHGTKQSKSGTENVYTKNFDRDQPINTQNPKMTFPFLSAQSKCYIVPIYPEYHTELFPDSILRTESPADFVENAPHRNALSKVYICRSHFKDLRPGDIIVFYRTGKIHTGVATTVGIVESTIVDIPDAVTFIRLCRKRSVFTDNELMKYWNHYPNIKPFIVNFLYDHSFRKRPNLRWLNENGIIPDILDMPRGFREISREDLVKIAKYSIGK